VVLKRSALPFIFTSHTRLPDLIAALTAGTPERRPATASEALELLE
jgi:hypothetical protein